MSQAVAIQNETFVNLLGALKLEDYVPSPAAQALLQSESRYIKDLKINVGNALENNRHLTRKEALLIALGIALNERSTLLRHSFFGMAAEAGASGDELGEVVACASLMATNNIFYRFRHYVKKDVYTAQPAGIKMTVMAAPVLGKEFFELLSLVISSVNGCELCVTSHEQSVLQHGSSESRVLEAVRLGAVIRGLITVLS